MNFQLRFVLLKNDLETLSNIYFLLKIKQNKRFTKLLKETKTLSIYSDMPTIEDKPRHRPF